MVARVENRRAEGRSNSKGKMRDWKGLPNDLPSTQFPWSRGCDHRGCSLVVLWEGWS